MGLVGGKVERGEKLLVLVVQVATLPENREGSSSVTKSPV